MQVHPVVKKVYNALKEYIPQGACLLLAVSGGADSMVLADGKVPEWIPFYHPE